MNTENLLQIQEDIASYVAAHIGSPSGYVNRFGRRYADDPVDVTAYESVLRFYDFIAKPSEDRGKKILAELRHATQSHPHFSSAWAALAMTLTTLVSHDLTMSDSQTQILLNEAFEAASQATKRDSQNALAFHAMFSVCFHRGNMQRYRRAADRALHLNPNDTDLLAFYAVTQTCLGNIDTAIPFYERAIALNPRPPFWYGLANMAIMLQKDDCEGLIAQQEAFLETPNFWSDLMIIACHGLIDQADAVSDRVKNIQSKVDDVRASLERIVSLWQIYPELKDKLMTGWTKAGLIAEAD